MESKGEEKKSKRKKKKIVRRNGKQIWSQEKTNGGHNRSQTNERVRKGKGQQTVD